MEKAEVKEEKKDKVIFLTEEEAAVPSKITLEESADDGPPGLILPSGEINWNCPCLGGMAVGPCGMEFREAFSCFHYSTADPKGSDCIEKFANMQVCMSGYPDLYDKDKDEESDEGSANPEEALKKSEGTEPEESAPAEKAASESEKSTEQEKSGEAEKENAEKPSDSTETGKPAEDSKTS